jgi:glycosyltransferase involved in cell wall biosynthesis
MLVSVIIPTLDRPKPLLRAIQSVLGQTYREFELIVIIDKASPDPETLAALRTVTDPRLRFMANPRPGSAAGARNFGVDQAVGEWIAFLDDDDEWLPTKLERQLAFAAGRPPALVTCLSRIVTPYATFVAPQDIFDNSIALDEYMFDRRSLFGGSNGVQTSSFFLPRTLFDKVRFNIDSAHDDWELALRLAKQVPVRIETVPDILVVNYFEGPQASLTERSSSWARSFEWVEGMRPIFTPRAYSAFCLGAVGSRAAREGAYKAFPFLLRKAFQNGRPGPTQLLPFLLYWILPLGARKQLRGIFRKEV